MFDFYVIFWVFFGIFLFSCEGKKISVEILVREGVVNRGLEFVDEVLSRVIWLVIKDSGGGS